MPRTLQLDDSVDALYNWGVSRQFITALKIGRRWDSYRQISKPDKPIRTIRQLCEESTQTLIREVNNIGKTGVEQIRAALAQSGYYLKGEQK